MSWGLRCLAARSTPTPAAVLALQDCDADVRTPAHRKPFAGGFVFAVQCASNNENFVETLIFSEHEDGSQGWLVQFPRPAQHGGGVADTISCEKGGSREVTQ